MKKAMKKLMAALLAVAMVCAMAIPAWAAPATNGSITVKNTVDGKTYKIYKILDLETNGTGEDESTYTAFKYKATLLILVLTLNLTQMVMLLGKLPLRPLLILRLSLKRP